jgi:ABC-type sugar transport system permease subunit
MTTAARGSRRSGSAPRLSLRRRRQLQGLAYATPTILLVAVFFILPLLLVGRMSVSDWSLLSGDRGLNAPDNYTAIDSNRLYSPSIGPISPVLEQMGLTTEPISFLGAPLSALLSTTFLIVWKFAGLYMLILLVGLQAIPREVYEAAAVDGASRRQTLRRITLPLLRPSLALALILCITGSLLAFEQFYILTKGGPNNSTVTVVQLIYREAFQRQNLGTAAAISIVVLIVLLALNVVQFRGLRSPDKA